MVCAALIAFCAACQEPAPPPSEEPKVPERKPIETRRLNLGEPEVEETVQPPTPLSGELEIVTWSDERILGLLVEETREGYVLDVTVPRDGAGPRKIRRVPRSAVMTLKELRRR